MFQEIVTERLILRDLQAADAEAMLQYRSDPEVSRYQSWDPVSAEQLRSFLENLASKSPGTPGAWYQIGIALAVSGELIGDCGIHVLDDRRLAEIGITLSPRFQSYGYGTETLRAVISYLFGELRKHRVSASVDPRNVRSLRLMQRLGFRQEAHMVESLWFKGQWVDDVIFAIVEREWNPQEHRRA